MTVNFPLHNTKATPRGDFLLIRKQYCRLSCSTTRHAGAKEKKMFSSYSFLSATLDGDEWSLRPHFTPGTNWIGGWVGLRECLCTEARGKVLCLCRRSNPDRPCVVRLHSDWGTPAPTKSGLNKGAVLVLAWEGWGSPPNTFGWIVDATADSQN
jgi:hypothetical protein